MVNLNRQHMVNLNRHRVVSLTEYYNNDPRTTSHYLDSLSIEETFNVNDKLVKKKKKEIGVESEFVIWFQKE